MWMSSYNKICLTLVSSCCLCAACSTQRFLIVMLLPTVYLILSSDNNSLILCSAILGSKDCIALLWVACLAVTFLTHSQPKAAVSIATVRRCVLRRPSCWFTFNPSKDICPVASVLPVYLYFVLTSNTRVLT